ncbi:MAG: HDOD domain-containing protein [Bdellovibrionales bacterium]|nr:HDOD domain-containing protein [Bdellovibrionales bacterium]
MDDNDYHADEAAPGEVLQDEASEPPEHQSSSDDEHRSGGPQSMEMPAASYIVREARRLAGDRNVRVSDIATCVSQDPILILELLRVANSIHFIQDRPPITTAQTAVVHLGSQQVVEIIDKVGERAPLEDGDVYRALETLRFQAQRISICARVLANATRKDLASEAQTTALMSVLGHMMACYYFGYEYVSLSNELNRSSLAYRLSNHYNFDIRTQQMAYLRRHGFPEVLAFALDRDMTCKTPWRQPLRYLVQSAVELVEAWDGGKWEKYAPGQRLSSKSAVRLLQLKDDQYENVYQRCEEYLSSLSEVPAFTEDKKSSDDADAGRDAGGPIELDELDDDNDDVGESIENQEQNGAAEEGASLVEPISVDDIAPDSITAFMFANLPEPEFDEIEDFDLENPPEDFKYSRQAQWVIDEFAELFTGEEDPFRVLEDVMQRLIYRGPFSRAAVLKLSKDRRNAQILAAVGDGLESGTTISFKDPLSPVAGCRTQVKSFNAGKVEHTVAPFGITSFAVSPLNIEDDTPVALYADCGHDDSMPFEARRIFRYLVALINSIMPNIRDAA